jgi:hypothetical protein
MTGRWYRPGDALALVTGVGVVVTDAGHETLLTRLHAAPLTVSRVVEALTADGWASVPDFVCVVLEGDDVRVLVRGRHRVELAGTTLDGHGVTTWTEWAWPRADVAEVVVTSSDDDGHVLPIEGGIVAVSSLGWPVDDAVEPAPAEPVVEAPEPEPVADETPEPAPEPEPEPAPVAAAVPVKPRLPAVDSSATILETDDLEFDAMFGMTVPGRRPEDAAVRPVEPDPATEDDEPHAPAAAGAAAAPAGAPAAARATPPASPRTDVLGDHDGHTVARHGLPRRGAPTATRAPAAPRTGPSVLLTLSTGETYEVAARALIGRSPRSTAVTGAALPQLVVVDDPYVSSTHVEISVAGDAVRVTDLSTNGTTLTPPGGAEGVLVKGVPTDVGDGAVLRLSEQLTIGLALARSAAGGRA